MSRQIFVHNFSHSPQCFVGCCYCLGDVTIVVGLCGTLPSIAGVTWMHADGYEHLFRCKKCIVTLCASDQCHWPDELIL